MRLPSKFFLPISAFCLGLWILSLSSCYKFTDAAIPPEIQTVAIGYFENQSNFVVPGLSQKFTESLKEKFNNETNLFLVDREGDWEFQGVIMRYEVTPIAPTGNETTALNRLNISVKVEFINHVDEKGSWTSNFSRYADYESGKLLSEVEDALTTQINDQLIQDIFNKVATNW